MKLNSYFAWLLIKGIESVSETQCNNIFFSNSDFLSFYQFHRVFVSNVYISISLDLLSLKPKKVHLTNHFRTIIPVVVLFLDFW